MGLRLTHAVKYEVRYSPSGYFNWRSEEFEDLMREWGIDICYDNAEDPTSNVEVNMTEVGAKLEENTKKNTPDEQVLMKGYDGWNITLGDVREWYEDVMRTADIKGGYAHFAWF